MSITSVASNGETLRVTWDDGHISHFHYIWLRDNCPCSDCRHPQVGERTLDPFTIPLDIAPEEVKLDDTKALNITWPGDSHQSIYDPGWLRQHTYEQEEKAARRFRPTLWDTSTIAENQPEVTYASVMADDMGLLMWLRLLRQYGFAIVRGVPTEQGQVAKVAERISYLRPSNFGTIFSVESRPDPNSIAYTALKLNAHPDLVSRETQPGYSFYTVWFLRPPAAKAYLLMALLWPRSCGDSIPMIMIC